MDWPMSTTTRMGCGSFASSRRSPMWLRSAVALVLVASEAVDLITRLTFGPGAGPTLVKVEGTTKVGINPVDPDGPHGLGLSPNAQQYYVSTAHGVPYGYLWKIDAKTNEVLGNVELGNFPATLEVTTDGGCVYVVNFNLHGEMVP